MWASVYSFLLSPAFRSANQLWTGAFVASLFSLVPSMRFGSSFLAVTFYLVQAILVAQDTHMGSKLMASGLVMGASVVGCLTGGVVVTIAKGASFSPYVDLEDPNWEGFTALYCTLGVVGLAVLCINRVGADPPFLWAIGMMSCVGYGSILVPGELAPPPAAYVAAAAGFAPPLLPIVPWTWWNIVGYTLLDVVIGAGCNVTAALLVLPSYAGDELRAKTADALLGIGASVSRYSSKIFEPEQRGKAAAGGAPPTSVAIKVTGASPALVAEKAQLDVNGMEEQPPVGDDEGGQEGGRGSHVHPVAPAAAFALSGGEGLEPQLAPPGSDDAEVVDDEADEAAYLQMLHEATAVSRAPSAGVHKAGSAPMVSVSVVSGEQGFLLPQASEPRERGMERAPDELWALLSRARELLPFATLEPSFITGCAFEQGHWDAVLSATELLLRHVAALETIEEEKKAMGDATIESLMEVDLVPEFRLAFAQIAATCAAMAAIVRSSLSAAVRRADLEANLPSFSADLCSEGRWEETKAELSAKLHEGLRKYWRRIRSAHGEEVHILDGSRMRTLMFAVTLTHGICDAMDSVEAALRMALPPKPSTSAAAKARPATVPREGAASTGAPMATAAANGGLHSGATAGSAGTGTAAAIASPGPLPQSPARATAATSPAATAEAAGPKPGPPSPSPLSFFPAWLVAFASLTSGLPALMGLLQFFLVDVPAVFAPGGLMATMRSRVFQAGVKYFLALATVLLLIVGLRARQDDVGATASQYVPTDGFVAVCICMTERMEATVSNVVLWVLGTMLGGTLGLFAVWSPVLAQNPYGLMAIICGASFFAGLLVSHQHKRLVVLSLMTMASVINQQYQPYCGEPDGCHGTTSFFAGRVLSVIFGAVAAGITNLILPWFTSTWALQVMGGALESAVRVAQTAYEQYYREGQAALCDTHDRGDVAAQALLSQLPGGDKEERRSDTLARISQGLKSRGVGALTGPAPPSDTVVGAAQAVAGMLQRVQVSLVMDTTFWHSGVLATPPAVTHMLSWDFLLLDRLAAIVLTLRGPEVTGNFNGSAFQVLVVPLHQELTAILQCAGKLAKWTALLLDGDRSPEARDSLAGVMEQLAQCRLKVHHQIVANIRAFHVRTRGAPSGHISFLTHPDDAVRCFSFLYGLNKFLDMATRIASAVLEHHAT